MSGRVLVGFLVSILSLEASAQECGARGGLAGLGDLVNEAAGPVPANGKVSPKLQGIVDGLAKLVAEADALPVTTEGSRERMRWSDKNANLKNGWATKFPAIRDTHEWAALPEGARASADTVGRHLTQNGGSVVALHAARNFAEVVASGLLQNPAGADPMAKLAAMIAAGEPTASDAVFLLADSKALGALVNGASLASETFDPNAILAAAGPVNDAVSGKLCSSNNPTRSIGGAAEFVYASWHSGKDPVDRARSKASARVEDTGEAKSELLDARESAVRFARTLTEESMAAGWGNCAENARAAAVMLHDAGVPWVEVMKKNGNATGGGLHAFVVVGRAIGSDPNDPATWGANAVVVDPWSGKKPFKVADALAAGKLAIPGEGPMTVQFRMPEPAPVFAPKKAGVVAAPACGANGPRVVLAPPVKQDTAVTQKAAAAGWFRQ